MSYWLMKSEPDVFSIDDLKRVGTEHWDGVRNFQVRNMLRDNFRRGDLAFFYHSSCEIPGIAGIMSVSREGYPDFTALDPESTYYDPKSTADNPRWYMVDVKFKRKLKRLIPLEELKSDPELQDLSLVKRGNRLSIMPLTEMQWQRILSHE
ncbi:MAG TPA: EVE domain-containing protein [Gammaproteobacteria bacterium]|jgi:predicted RNA-binding protein with PUA-like domain